MKKKRILLLLPLLIALALVTASVCVAEPREYGREKGPDGHGPMMKGPGGARTWTKGTNGSRRTVGS
jgi:hypothetical protein